MITKTDIITFARHIVRRGKGLPDRRIMHPFREWYLGLSVAALLVIAGAGYNFYLFRYYNAIETHVTEDAIETVEYQYSIATRVQERFDTRAAEFARLRGTSRSFVPAASLDNVGSGNAATSASDIQLAH